MESPPLRTSAGAGFSVAISVFNSSISLTAFISRPIRTISPGSFCPLWGILAHFNLANWRHRAFQCIQILGIRSTVRIPHLRPCLCWAASILSYQHCGNRLLSSTGGAEVTGGGFFLCIAVHAEPSKDGHPPGHSRVKALPPAPQGWATHKILSFLVLMTYTIAVSREEK